MCSYLTVASSEALAAGASILPGVLQPASGGQSQTEAPVETGSAFAGVRTRSGLGRGGFSRGRGVRGQLEERGECPDAAAAVEEQEDEEKGGHEAPCQLCGTAERDCRHAAHTHPHPEPRTLASAISFCVVFPLCAQSSS